VCVCVSVCRKLQGILPTGNRGPCFLLAENNKFGNCRKLVCVVAIEFKLLAGHRQLILSDISIYVHLSASIIVN